MSISAPTTPGIRCWARALCAYALRMTGVLAILAAAGSFQPGRAQTDDETEAPSLRHLDIDNDTWSGDFDGMIERRLVRVAVPYGRTLFYHDRGRERGLTADTARKFEEYLNKKYEKDLKKRPLTVVLIPTTRDRLISALLEGRADIAAGNITITEGRSAQVDFSAPIAKPFSEIIVTGPGAPALATLDDLAGKEVFVRPATSYYESLTALNERFRAAVKPLMTLTLLPDPIEDEDKLDMINAGLLGISVVDEWLADVWTPILPQVVARKDLVLRSGGQAAWAFRKGSPRLQAEIDDFVTNVVRNHGLVASDLKAFSAKLRTAQNAKAGKDWERFQQVVELFRKYGPQYRFDYLLLTAQGYQESQLDQSARSQVGAIGIMQLMPATGNEMKVGDISRAEPNVHAGAKYMDQLMDSYFQDAELDDENRTLFAFAAYNAGPGRVVQLRKLAAEQGYDPNKWFNNVEWVMADKVGQEPVTYVRNIYKYYVSYKLAVEAERSEREAAGKVRQSAPAP